MKIERIHKVIKEMEKKNLKQIIAVSYTHLAVYKRQYLHSEALKWEKWHNGRSQRSARQFIDWLQGAVESKG